MRSPASHREADQIVVRRQPRESFDCSEDVRRTYAGYRQDERKQKRWAADNPGNVAIRQETLAKTLELAAEKIGDGGQVLDLGCGNGWLLSELTKVGVDPARLHGIDLIEDRVAAAKDRIPDADFQVGDALDLPFSDGEFDLVFAFTVFSSMTGGHFVETALAEARRVMRPGGLLVCYEPRVPNPFNSRTILISPRVLSRIFGNPARTLRLTGFPSLARHLGPLTSVMYPVLSRIAPTHRLAAYEVSD